VRSALARGLATGRSGLVGMIVPDITNPGFGLTARGCEDELRAHGLNLLVCNSDEHADKELEICQLLQQQRVDGLIYSSNCATPMLPNGKTVIPRDVPAVYIERALDAPRIDGVYIDNEAAGRIAAEFILGMGHRDIAVVTGFANTITTQVRLQALRSALAVHGVDIPATHLIQGDFKLTGGRAAAEAILALPRLPTAVYAMSDLMAYGLMGRFAEAGLRVPDDISLVGTDDLPLSAAMVPPLTTLAAGLYELGQEAARLLLRRIKKPESPARRSIMPVHLVERASCKSLV
jgi:LacI family transcriptional regulator